MSHTCTFCFVRRCVNEERQKFNLVTDSQRARIRFLQQFEF